MTANTKPAETPFPVICPRECPSPRTDHCCGWAIGGRARCWHCGRFMPMAEAIEFVGGEVMGGHQTEDED